MLTDHKKKKATEIAKLLVKEGMIFGKELYEFIKAEEIYGVLNFKSEEELEQVIDFIIGYVEKSWGKVLVVKDVEEGIIRHFTDISSAAKFIKTTETNIRYAKSTKSYIKKRYTVDSYKPKIAVYCEGMEAMKARWSI